MISFRESYSLTLSIDMQRILFNTSLKITGGISSHDQIGVDPDKSQKTIDSNLTAPKTKKKTGTRPETVRLIRDLVIGTAKIIFGE